MIRRFLINILELILKKCEERLNSGAGEKIKTNETVYAILKNKEGVKYV